MYIQLPPHISSSIIDISKSFIHICNMPNNGSIKVHVMSFTTNLPSVSHCGANAFFTKKTK